MTKNDENNALVRMIFYQLASHQLLMLKTQNHNVRNAGSLIRKSKETRMLRGQYDVPLLSQSLWPVLMFAATLGVVATPRLSNYLKVLLIGMLGLMSSFIIDVDIRPLHIRQTFQLDLQLLSNIMGVSQTSLRIHDNVDLSD